MGAKKGPSTMSDEHKAALAEGRSQSRAVRNYLNALDAHRPKRGRKRTPESIAKRLEKLEGEIPAADPIRRVSLVQERMDLEEELDRASHQIDLTELEASFVAAAAGYSERKGISYAAWREVGVPAPVLKSAGIRRGGA